MKRALQTLKNISFSIISLGLMLFLTHCNYSKPGEEGETSRTVKINYTNWTESIAITMLARVILEEKMGYKVELKLADVAQTYADVASGDADFFADAWLPYSQGDYFTRYKEMIDTVGVLYKTPRIGLVVPDYSNLISIIDLKDSDIPITGIDEGAGIMNSTREALSTYGLKNELLTLSDEEMTFQLMDSLKRRKNIVVTGWEPHWIFNRYEVRFLEDPDQVFPTNEHIYTIATRNMQDKHPHAYEFFRRLQLTEEQFNNLIDNVKLATDPVNGVHQWIKKNEYIVNKWVRNLQPERLKIM